jgi:S-adenosylmethionine decarboxylase
MKNVGGRHLIIDGFVRDASTLNPTYIKEMFDVLVDTLGMVYLHRPMVFEVPIEINKIETEEDEGGWSVFAQITTSHIAIHTWPARKAFSMDVYSCKDYDANTAGVLIWRTLGIDNCVIYNIWRDGFHKVPQTGHPIQMWKEWNVLGNDTGPENLNTILF